MQSWGVACRSGARLLVGTLLCSVLGGCATAAFEQAASHYYAGDPVAAVAVLDRAVADDSIPDRDELLLHLERGSMLHSAGLYRESAEAFVSASKLIAQNDRLSVSAEARALLSNDWSKRYLGEYSEQLLAHSYAMMDFILSGQRQSAAVEARQSLKLLQAHTDSLQGDSFSQAMIALSFELAGQPNDAYVSYRQLQNRSAGLPLSTYRAAERVASSEGMSKWRAAVGDALWRRHKRSASDAVVFVGIGRGPIKTSGSLVQGAERLSFPAYQPVAQQLQGASVVSERGQSLPFERVATDVLSVSRAALAERGKKALAKALLRGKLKHEIVKELRGENQAAAEVLQIAFFLLEQADTRYWRSLPARFELLRVPLKKDQKRLRVRVGANEKMIELNPRAKGTQVFALTF